MKVHIETYGCTANQSDSQQMKDILLRNDHEIVDSVENAEIVIVNTCTVTERTDRQMLKRLREFLHIWLVLSMNKVKNDVERRVW